MSIRWSSALCALLLSFSISTAGLAAEVVETRESQPCWILKSDRIEVAVTQLGGHMAPVTFRANSDEPIRPYYVSPWQGEEDVDLPVPVLHPLRGDFFCMPFGGNAAAFKGEQHPPHGEVAGERWTFVSQETGKTSDGRPLHTLTLSLKTQVRPGTVTKRILLVDGEDAIYTQHIVEGFRGPTPIAHHATLSLPSEPRSVQIVTSPFRFGMTNPTLFSDPEKREYQALAIGATFQDLHKVPVLRKGEPDADLTAFPDRTGFADLIALANEPDPNAPAWVTAYNSVAKAMWFSLKDPAVLPTTVFWIENHGRHASPWNGRNRCLGLEDVCADFAEGLVPSIEKNPLSDKGVKTVHELTGDKPFVVNYIQGAVPADAAVSKIDFAANQMTVTTTAGKAVKIPVRHSFLKSGKL